ncbi:sulfate/molybdate ABC transporter ATP-binding protein [Beijerinckia indica]|uniref:Sulfate ABC transporter, ATPase subunit n=1 Tax=Beijerinckia indica subsp. indica (strain ATCC 9039 / DSM 1715 / NCIMB 8712) TaxID=395963 RepID=B2IH89_BEII9|nr:sulfate/molybdate ABC transporter ATP-binding protein [Beijerinckia indica]ACB95874.1 sulfate ABC transporter, ATPase subunit [Beijerinckia indica subsp. indica ATCC 9039]
MQIRALDIIKRFDEQSKGAVLDRVNLNVVSGELLALLGPSGSGKTTLLRIIAGLDTPSEGSIFFGEEDASQLSVQERRVGFVFQNYALFKHLNLEDNIAFGLTVRDSSTRPPKGEIRRRALELLDLVQLSGLGKRYPAQLSGGQRQRVALARALAVEPRVLLLDEPFGALDAKVRRDLRSWLREIHDRTGHTTLFVTHDQDEALELADRVAVLSQGRIEQIGSPDDIYDRPATAFVHGFIGEASALKAVAREGHVFVGDKQLALPVRQTGNGKGRLFIRPQDVVIAQGGHATIDAELVSLRRSGPIRRAEVALAGDAGRIEIDAPATLTLAPGEKIPLHFLRGTFYPDTQTA